MHRKPPTTTVEVARALIGKPLEKAKFGKLEKQGVFTTAWLRERGVKPNELTDWRKGGIPHHRLDELLRAFHGILPGTEQEPPEPVWVERLLAGVMALETKAGITPDELDVAAAAAAAYLVVARQGRHGPGGDGGAMGSAS